MNRFWLGVVLLVLFLAIGIGAMMGMNVTQNPIADKLEQASQEALSGNLPRGIALARQAEEDWLGVWRGTAAIEDHAPMDEIDSLFAQMAVYAKTGSTVDFAAYCARLSKLIAAMGEAHSLSWWTLL